MSEHTPEPEQDLAHMVGERSPELYVPGSSGYVHGESSDGRGAPDQRGR